MPSPSPGRRRNKRTSGESSRFFHAQFSVQDRRHNARIHQETAKRKAQLMPLTTADVARRMHHYRDEPDLLDEHKTRCVAMTNVRGGGATSPTDSRSSPPQTLDTSRTEATTDLSQHDRPIHPRMSYDEWAERGFPICSWTELLTENLYGPIEAEKLYYKAKYSAEGTFRIPADRRNVGREVVEDAESHLESSMGLGTSSQLNTDSLWGSVRNLGSSAVLGNSLQHTDVSERSRLLLEAPTPHNNSSILPSIYHSSQSTGRV